MNTLEDKIKKADIKTEPKKSWQWYMNHIRTTNASLTAQQYLGQNVQLQSTRILPGQLIAFGYDPKTKEDLPYYDTFPLVLPWKASSTHFIGINLHYVHPRYRLAILDKLLLIRGNKKITEKTRLQLTWNTIQGLSKSTGVEHCVKQYLFGHVKSRFIVIPPGDDFDNWKSVVFLPLCRFKKKSASEVWKMSK